MTDKFFAFDLETTGLHVVNDRIITAAVVGDFLPNGGASLLLNPGIRISAEASAVHGITDEKAAAGMDYATGLALLGDMLTDAWARGGTLVGHNVNGFDLPMLRMQERAMFGSPRTRIGNVIDTFTEFRRAFVGVPATLTSAAGELGVSLTNAHDAVADARASLEIAKALEARKLALA